MTQSISGRRCCHYVIVPFKILHLSATFKGQENKPHQATMPQEFREAVDEKCPRDLLNRMGER